MIAGPTATGKSEVALAVAEMIGGEIVNADSVQVYRHCDIGTAKPGEEEREKVPHHLYDIADPDQEFNAGLYEKLAEEKVLSIAQRGKLPRVVGGTGLYIKALLWGLSVPLAKDQAVRNRLNRKWEEHGGDALYKRLEECDPVLATQYDPRDRVRIVRALEIFELTGKPPSSLMAWQPKPHLHATTIALDLPRELLRERIETRVDRMLQAGLVEETRRIIEMGYPSNSPPLQAIGYRQVVKHLKGELEFSPMVDEIKRATKRYAKRQRTWFKKEGFTWVDARDKKGAVKTVMEIFEKKAEGFKPNS